MGGRGAFDNCEEAMIKKPILIATAICKRCGYIKLGTTPEPPRQYCTICIAITEHWRLVY